MTAEERIIRVLKEKQIELNLRTMAFADYLGISASLWVKIRDGKRPLNSFAASAAGNRFPELESYVLIFLRHELPTRNRKLKACI
jgi:hypothetical protein